MKEGDTVVCIKGIREVETDQEYVILSIEQGIDRNTMTFREGFLFAGCVDIYNPARFRPLEPHSFTNALTKELANTPIIEEKVEKARELETV